MGVDIGARRARAGGFFFLSGTGGHTNLEGGIGVDYYYMQGWRSAPGLARRRFGDGDRWGLVGVGWSDDGRMEVIHLKKGWDFIRHDRGKQMDLLITLIHLG